MRGRPTRQPNLFVSINLEALVPIDHPLRPIKRLADEALAAMNRTFTAAYSTTGRPSVPPERLLRRARGRGGSTSVAAGTRPSRQANESANSTKRSSAD